MAKLTPRNLSFVNKYTSVKIYTFILIFILSFVNWLNFGGVSAVFLIKIAVFTLKI